jgi:hypothetical protein
VNATIALIPESAAEPYIAVITVISHVALQYLGSSQHYPDDPAASDSHPRDAATTSIFPERLLHPALLLPSIPFGVIDGPPRIPSRYGGGAGKAADGRCCPSVGSGV